MSGTTFAKFGVPPTFVGKAGILEPTRNYPIKLKCNIGLCKDITEIHKVNQPSPDGGLLIVMFYYMNKSQLPIEKLFSRQYALTQKEMYYKFFLELTMFGSHGFIKEQWHLHECSIACLESSDTYGNHFQYYYTEMKIQYEAAEKVFSMV